MHLFINKTLIFLLVSTFSFIHAQGISEKLSSKLDTLLAYPFFESTLAAVDVYNLSKNVSLYQKNAKMLLHPASNMKILTSAAGLLFLGQDYNFKTRLLYTGEIINKTLHGDIYIAGGCDPDFTSADLDPMVSVISSAGIEEMTGDIYGDVSMADSLFWGNGWMWDDDPSSDAPYLSALNINHNAIEVYVTPTKPGLPASIHTLPETGYISIDNKTITVDSAEAADYYIDRDWIDRKNTIIARGTVPIVTTNGSLDLYRSINIFKPELYFLTLFKEALNKKGIKFNGNLKFAQTPVNSVNLFSINKPYDSVMVYMNKESDNLSAEMILRVLSEKYYGKPANAAGGINLIDSLVLLAGMNPFQYYIVDGSGLSMYNLVSAELILSVLKYIYYNENSLYKILYSSFPIAGLDGTLKNRMKNTPAENNVHAKTGTLTGIKTLSGYLTARNGDTIAFSILIQNYVSSNRAVYFFQNEICNILINYNE